MAITARSHGFFDNAIVGWSHAARSDVTYRKERCENVFAIFILIHLLSLFLKTSLSNGSGNMALITKNVRDKGTWE
jgi:hypothetical protein